jgi:hypothetical protein
VTTERVLYSDALVTIVETISDLPPDSPGGWRSVRHDWAEGTPQANSDALQGLVREAVANHRAFLAGASPTNAQVVAQVRALTLTQIRLLRLIFGLLDGTG